MLYTASLVFLLYFCAAPHADAGAKVQQRVQVSGQVNCRNKPYQNATIRLLNKNFFKDSVMAEQVTGKDGKFSLDGRSSDWISDIDAILKIYHRCNVNSTWKCTRELVYTIPEDFIFAENNPKIEPIIFGQAELMMKPNEESSKCLGAPTGK